MKHKFPSNLIGRVVDGKRKSSGMQLRAQHSIKSQNGVHHDQSLKNLLSPKRSHKSPEGFKRVEECDSVIKEMKMKVLIVCVCLVAITNGQDDTQYDRDYKQKIQKETTTWIPILKYNKEQNEDGSYKTQYETGNNIIHEESGFLKDFSEDHPNGVLVQHGTYSYEAPDGQIVNVQYTADENGFRATGDHIPTTPPIPEEIQKGLDQIYAGIKLQQQRSAERAKTDPDFARKLEERHVANQNGQYIADN